MTNLKPGTIWPGQAKVELTQEQFDELATSDMTFTEIEEKYGEEVAIDVGIARDPDAPELTPEQMARMRPAIEVFPALVEESIRKQWRERPSAKQYVTLPLDGDLLIHFLDADGPDWHNQLNDTLRQAVFGPESA